MAINKETFLDDVKAFFDDSLSWCQSESEKESNLILTTLQSIMDDVKRRSKMSQAAETAFLEAEEKLAKLVQETSRNIDLGEMKSELEALKSDSIEVSRLMNPVIEALQFQDQLTQNLQGIRAVIHTWTEHIKENDPDNSTEQDGKDFANKLLKVVKTPHERNLVRKHFGLGEEETVMNGAPAGDYV